MISSTSNLIHQVELFFFQFLSSTSFSSHHHHLEQKKERLHTFSFSLSLSLSVLTILHSLSPSLSLSLFLLRFLCTHLQAYIHILYRRAVTKVESIYRTYISNIRDIYIQCVSLYVLFQYRPRHFHIYSIGIFILFLAMEA